MNQTTSLRRTAVSGLLWSLVQNWGGKIFGLVVFVLLARLLQPEEFGIASSAFLILTILHLVAEFGLGDALVQRPSLTRADVTIPFFAAMTLSVSLASGMALFSDEIAAQMGVAGLGPYLAVSAAIGPLMTLSALQEALYRRELKFRPLAIRTLAGVLIGGGVGVVMALAGFGTWALIAQFGAQMLTSVVWLWLRPVWTPTRETNAKSAVEIGRFGANVLSTYLLDFVTMKSVDFIILIVYGPVALGLYTVASRLYQLLLQMLQTSISSVGLSMLSKVSGDLPRMRRLYERSTSISALFGMPIFIALAALAPEVNHIMFGAKWAGADQLMVPLLLIGGVHCIQFLNVAYLTSLGKPNTLVRLGLLKAILILPPLYFIRMDSVASTVNLYAFSLLLLSPLSFGATLRALGLGWGALLLPVFLPALASGLAFGAVLAVRHFALFPVENVFLSALLLGALFSLVYAAAIAILAFRSAREVVIYAIGAFRR
ncbi:MULTISPECIES: oligosaccharide flippase family protein [unclassified Aureimonas]|uniref:oligosaccharide flippase family protein n=1 Tax=unclassified Aureimonas TaxID=2615206 RepID=UPI0006FAC546|nr:MULTISPECIES: oligosaccharide flippase family protein [unclassified Aureimonas]KQT69588.1 hypothetical protein ASG62_00115 [Aureimonas sp. Leaf427]KQT80938.1 hypothetical protein ASG54_05640 [Aureimonas sp. Leaf460]